MEGSGIGKDVGLGRMLDWGRMLDCGVNIWDWGGSGIQEDV